jgi:hypothetical protein
MSKRIDFYITNPNHHWENFKPVMQKLLKEGFNVRLVSLCEFRRMETPVEELKALNIPYSILFSLKFKNTSTSTGKKHIGGNKAFVRTILRSLIWFFKLRSSLIKENQVLPDAAIIPNDIAYPMSNICKWLQAKKVKTILYQEGIRFPLPNEVGGPKYGTNGTDFIYTWGKNSSDYFQSVGINPEKIRTIGNPRFDEMLNQDYSEVIELIKKKHKFATINIMYASNPIDDQGFCTYNQKLKLFESFLKQVSKQKSKVKIWLRLHPRENKVDFEKIIKEFQSQVEVGFLQEYSLFACLKLMDACVVLASTVGLEALLNDVALAVIKMPNNHNYIFDYVSSKAAVPLDVFDDLDFKSNFEQLLQQKAKGLNAQQKKYTDKQMANQGYSEEVFFEHLRQDLDNN